MSGSVLSPYVEFCGGAYYIAGSRVSLASVIRAFRRGASPEGILEDFPYIGSLGKVYGAIAFMLENPARVEEYLADQERIWEDLEGKRPLPSDMLARLEKARELLKRQPA